MFYANLELKLFLGFQRQNFQSIYVSVFEWEASLQFLLAVHLAWLVPVKLESVPFDFESCKLQLVLSLNNY